MLSTPVAVARVVVAGTVVVMLMGTVVVLVVKTVLDACGRKEVNLEIKASGGWMEFVEMTGLGSFVN